MRKLVKETLQKKSWTACNATLCSNFASPIIVSRIDAANHPMYIYCTQENLDLDASQNTSELTDNFSAI